MLQHVHVVKKKRLSISSMFKTITPLQLAMPSNNSCIYLSPLLKCSYSVCMYSMSAGKFVHMFSSGELWPITSAPIFTFSLRLVTWKRNMLFSFDCQPSGCQNRLRECSLILPDPCNTAISLVL